MTRLRLLARGRIPAQVAGREVPFRFHSWKMRLASPVPVLCDFIAWLEESQDALREDRTRNGAARGGEDPSGACQAQRAALVDACIDVRERVESTGIKRRLAAALDQAGVQPFTCDGEVFDPERHDALERVDTQDPSQHNLIAATLGAGYEAGNRVLRQPTVAVYRFREPCE